MFSFLWRCWCFVYFSLFPVCSCLGFGVLFWLFHVKFVPFWLFPSSVIFFLRVCDIFRLDLTFSFLFPGTFTTVATAASPARRFSGKLPTFFTSGSGLNPVLVEFVGRQKWPTEKEKKNFKANVGKKNLKMIREQMTVLTTIPVPTHGR